ncbi:alcohol dehydrogenase-like 7 [Alnus glutinosa]|uniref:alcohol dehydrogenase-like 7 n=1 Tax=Alnus glutinosa TaxID=3517 RepID=UPI002D781F13|nr:alcohol dehydrogenase-like 7 [Alnus glutinosa]
MGPFAKKIKKHIFGLTKSKTEFWEKLENKAVSIDKSPISQRNPKQAQNLVSTSDKTATSDSTGDKTTTSDSTGDKMATSDNTGDKMTTSDSTGDKTATSDRTGDKTTASYRTGDKTATNGKPIRCKAAVGRAPGEPLVIEEIMVAPPMPREVRIRIICSSLCHTDVSIWKLKVDPPGIFPRIFGHEAIGVVESVGEDVDEVTEGDTVIPTFVSDCGECENCRSKKSNLCSKLPFTVSQWMPRYETSRFTDLNGEVIYHFMFVSSFSEYTVVDVAHVTKFDPSIPPNRACLFSCGVSTGVGAAWKTANVEAGSTVAIFGLGSIGLAVSEGARLCGATTIIGVDLNPDKYEIGKKFGVTDFVNAGNCGDKSVSQVINEMTNGGADYCFECIGSASLVHEAYACCRNCWGKTVMVGVARPGSELGLSFHDVLNAGGKSIMGSIFGGLKPKSDIPILLKRYLDKELQLDGFVTHEIQFEDINKAFDLLIEGQSLRCVIWMDK